MNTTRFEAFWMQALRLTVVRRSLHSMMPTFKVFSGSDSIFSTRPNSSQVSATSSGPCVFSSTIQTDPVRLLQGFRNASSRSWIAGQSGDGGVESLPRFSPLKSSTASVNMWWPTLRISSRLRPCSLSSLPVRRLVNAVGVERALRVLPPFSKSAESVPFIKPSVLR